MKRENNKTSNGSHPCHHIISLSQMGSLDFTLQRLQWATLVLGWCQEKANKRTRFYSQQQDKTTTHQWKPYKRLVGLKHLSSLWHHHKAWLRFRAAFLPFSPCWIGEATQGVVMRCVSSSQPGRYIMTDRSPNLAKGINLQIQTGEWTLNSTDSMNSTLI